MSTPKLIYLTSKGFPATTADHIYVQSLARSFANVLGKRFLLVISNEAPADLTGIPTHTVAVPRILFRTLYYFLWFPFFVRRVGTSDTVLFSNEQHLLIVALFWRRVLGFSYRICSDWHLMTDTWRDGYVAEGGDLLITTSKRLKDKIVDRTGVSEGKIHVVYGGVDLEPYTVPLCSRAELGLPEEPFLLGYIGLFTSLGNDKGLRTILDALTFLPKNVQAVFVGGNTEEVSTYRAYAEERHVADRCIWIPRQKPDCVPAFERSMNALVIPYPDTKHFRDYGFPMKVYEYLASGRPILYSDLEIIREVLKGKGIAFKPGDARSLADAVTKVETKQVTAVPGADQVTAYSWDTKAEAILSVLVGEAERSS